MGQRVCIIGGSGFVGRAIVHEAISQGHQVTVACRHPERARSLLLSCERLVRADVADGSGLDDAVQGADIVINLVGLLFEKGRYNFETVHVQGTEHVLAACTKAGVSQYLHMSALGAGQVEDSKYSMSKGAAEDQVRQTEINWTIFRPSIIYGAGDSFFNKFKKMTDILPVLPVISWYTRFQPVWVEDVARAFVASIGNKHVTGKEFELAGPKVYKFRQLQELLMDTLGRKRMLFSMPDKVAELLAAVTRFLPTPSITKDQLILLKHDNVVQGEAFPKIFGDPSALEDILPTFICGSHTEHMQSQMDRSRNHYRKGSI
jgi:NADH dehydrogenase